MKTKFFVSLLTLAFMGNLAIRANARDNSNSNLTIQIDGLKNQRGRVCLSLFSSSRGFPNDGNRALQARCINLKETTPAITFDNLKPGSYAVAAFHDINDDGIFNFNRFGIPQEGFGFSRNPQIVSGPPKFGDVVVILVSPQNKIRIELRYF